MSNIAATIKELEAKKAAIESALTSLRAITNSNGTAGPGKRQTIIGGVIAHLMKVDGPQSSAEIREALSAAGVHASAMSIQTMMSKRARLKKDLIHKGRGLWGLKK